jgi:site-specific recombinase XerC
MLGPQTLTRAEQDALLSATSGRDHLIFSLALGTGLRLAELVGLNVGDVYLDGTPRQKIRLRCEIAKGSRTGDVFLPDALIPKLEQFWGYKRRAGEGLKPDSPLFCNQSRERISKRRVQHAFRCWQTKAGFDHFYPPHALRHAGNDCLSGGCQPPKCFFTLSIPVA